MLGVDTGASSAVGDAQESMGRLLCVENLVQQEWCVVFAVAIVDDDSVWVVGGVMEDLLEDHACCCCCY